MSKWRFGDTRPFLFVVGRQRDVRIFIGSVDEAMREQYDKLFREFDDGTPEYRQKEKAIMDAAWAKVLKWAGASPTEIAWCPLVLKSGAAQKDWPEHWPILEYWNKWQKDKANLKKRAEDYYGHPPSE